jgi:hypothetical protein
MYKDVEMPHNITPLMLKLKALKDIGYEQDFMITSEGLKCLGSGKVYQPSDIKIMDHFRFEGISDPEDMDILYTIVASDGIKGTVMDAFGPYADTDLMDFMKQVEDHTIENL